MSQLLKMKNNKSAAESDACANAAVFTPVVICNKN
jgi:hypothetical protein